MEKKIYIDNVWGKVRQDRKGVIVEIENHGQIFKWLPTYADVAEIVKLLEQVEVMNDEHRCKDN